MSKRSKSFQMPFVAAAVLIFIAGALWAPPSTSPNRESAVVKEKGKQSGHPDGLKFRRLQMQDEKGEIPADGLEKARRHVNLMKAAQKERAGKGGEGITGAIERDSWTWLGPGNVGGRIRSIVIHPTITNRMWVGSVSGGIWRTDNGGASWQPVDDFMANLAVSTMVIHPTDPNRIYAGTGEGFGNVDAIQGAGIFQSTNGGGRWDPLGFTSGNVNFNFVNRLAISANATTTTLLAATNSGVWRSVDDGVNWTRETTTQALDIDFHPTDSNRAILGGLGAARFTTDGGDTWAAATFNPAITNGGTPATDGRVELAYARSNPNIIYASVNNNNGIIYRCTNGSTNVGLTFSSTLTLGHLANQGWYDNSIWVNPQDPNNVIVGGIHLWRSTNGAASFLQISDGSDSPHADHHVIVQHPGFNGSTNRVVYFGNDGGIYRTDDVAFAGEGSGWVELNNNLGVTQFYGAAGNAATGVIVGGTQDNGTLRFSGNTQGWTQTFGSDGGYCASDPTDSNFFYGETQWLGLIRSANGGVSAISINAGITDATCTPPPGGTCTPPTNFISPIALDPNEPNTLLAGGISLWRTNNAKSPFPSPIPEWTAVKAPTGGNSPISAIVVSPGSSSIICVGHNNGDIYRTTNGTAGSPAWTRIDTAALPNRFVTRLVIDNTRSPNWIYATFGGFSADNVYRSTDNGNTWADITGTGVTGLPDVPVRALVLHPHNKNLIYVGTEVGIFSSGDGGATWDVSQDGPANVSVDELFWLGLDLIAVTHGRGLYRASGGIYVDCNYNGLQVGTFDQPFKTVTAAVNAMRDFNLTYRPIWLKPCNYNESFIMPPINKRLELRGLGGTSVIGRP